MTAPARRDDLVDFLHGIAVPDPYRWLEDATSAETIAWVADNNRITREALDARPDRERWHERLVALTRLRVVGAAAVRGDRLFAWEREPAGQQIGVSLRSAIDPDQPPRLLLDPAGWSTDATTAIDWFVPSSDGRLLAYGVSEGGTERSVLRIVDVDSGEHLADQIPDTRACSLSWLPAGDGFAYTRFAPNDEYGRRIYLHRLGAEWADDELVWGHDVEPEVWADVSLSRTGRWLLVHAMHGWGRVDVSMLDRDSGAWTDVIAGVDATNRFEVVGDRLIGLTTLDAPRGRVVTAPLATPGEWTTLVSEGDSVRGGFEVVGDELLSVASRRAVDRIERHRMADGEFLGTLDGLGLVSVSAPSADPAAATPAAFFSVTSFTAPTALYRWTPSDGVRRWAGDTADLPAIEVRYVRYPSSGGVEVGMFVVHAVGQTPDPSTPALLNGYGGFAISETPAFLPHVVAWCEAGGLYALAGLRGGLEEGKDWHDAGRRANKQHTFDDFHAAAEYLVDRGLTSHERLGIYGGSNGGLLVGAALTQRPELYRAVWCAVPLLDMIRYPQFLIARLWTSEYGDPAIPEEFGWLWAYSPYHRVAEGTGYPAVLLTAAEGDSRVDPLHARKMAAMLQHAAIDQEQRPILLYQEARAGHGVGKPVHRRMSEYADVLTFFTWQLGAV